MVFWWALYPAKGPSLASVMAREMTPIVVALWLPGIYSSPTRIMAPQAIPILCQMELHLFRSPTYGFLMGAISGQRLHA